LTDLYEAGCVFVLARSRNGSHRVFKQPAAERSSQLLFGLRAVHPVLVGGSPILVASSATLNCWHYSSDYLTKNTEGDRPGDKLFDLRGISCTASTPEKEEIRKRFRKTRNAKLHVYSWREGKGNGKRKRATWSTWQKQKKIGFVWK